MDVGPGMSPDEAHNAFERFYRGERRGEVTGSGLGLAIAKRAIERSRGSISFTSAPGAGTTFTIELPELPIAVAYLRTSYLADPSADFLLLGKRPSTTRPFGTRLWSEAAGREDGAHPMTLSVPRRRTRNYLLLALVLSLLIHVAGGELWGLFPARTWARIAPHPIVMASLQETPAPQAEVIRIERRPKAVARQAHENEAVKVAPHPHPRPTVAPVLPRPRHELAHVRVYALGAAAAVSHTKSLAAETPHVAKPIGVRSRPR